MVKALFDTNILIDYLNGHAEAKSELALYKKKWISVITWMEVMVGSTPATESALQSFLSDFTRLPIDDGVSKLAVTLRQKYKIKLPDAIIWATAQHNSMILVSRNTNDFSGTEPGIRVPYKL
jgi:hypothetical protein